MVLSESSWELWEDWSILNSHTFWLIGKIKLQYTQIFLLIFIETNRRNPHLQLLKCLLEFRQIILLLQYYSHISIVFFLCHMFKYHINWCLTLCPKIFSRWFKILIWNQIGLFPNSCRLLKRFFWDSFWDLRLIHSFKTYKQSSWFNSTCKNSFCLQKL